MLGSHHSSLSGRFIAAGGAGLLLGLLANPLRKLAVQAPTMLKKKWDEALAAEHEATLALIDLMEATSEDDTARRAMHLSQLKHSLSKHSFQEENTVYAMMRERGLLEPAQMLNEEHGEIKRLLFDLTEMPKSDPQWIERLRELRGALEHHMAEEENQHFPKLRAELSEEENTRLSVAMNKEGLKVA
jgi:iron-sulfur cluster repair protein YtfE (RIC family)